MEQEFFASCLTGLESVLADELRSLGIEKLRPLRGGVAFFGTDTDAYKACLWSRLASRIVLVIARVGAKDAHELYDGVAGIAWEAIIVHGATIGVHASGTNDSLRNSRFTALKTKDAIVDELRLAAQAEESGVSERETDSGERVAESSNFEDAALNGLDGSRASTVFAGGRRPTRATDEKIRASIDVRIRNNKATISLDLSGEALNHRWYLLAEDNANAPYECSLAAGALACGGWIGERALESCLLETSCHDGIMLIEAASVACDLAPGLGRTKWGFEAWQSYDEAAVGALKQDAQERFATCVQELLGSQVTIEQLGATPDAKTARFMGLSTSSPAISKARKQIRAAGLRALISVELGEASDCATAVKRLQGVSVGSKSEGKHMDTASDSGSDGAHKDALSEANNKHTGVLSTLPGKSTGATARLQDKRACVVVANLDAARQSGSAQARAESAAFLTAVRCVEGDRHSIALNGEGVVRDFPVEQHVQYVLGQGRARATVEVFTGVPIERPVVQVVDLDKGLEHEIGVNEQNSNQFAARFRKVFKDRRKWAAQNNVSCYRLYDADLPDYAVAIDWYEGAGQARGNSYLHISEYAPPASVDPELAKRRFSDVLAIAPVICGIRPDHVFSKQRIREKGGSQYAQAGNRSYVTTIDENGHLLEVNLGQRLDTGIFLDHRPVRRRIQELAKGKSFLNLFAYTGVASVYAAAGGATSVTTVDLSQVYLDWARRNMEANGFTGSQYVFVKADVMRWITQARRTKERFDLIFVDPPTFSNSKSMGKKTWDVQRDHVELLIGVTHLLTEDGMAIFSCNLRNFKPDLEKLEHYGVQLEDISSETIPEDFARTPKIHKCYIVRKVKA